MAVKYLTVKQAATFLRVTDSVVTEMVKANVFSARKRGNTLQVSKDDVDEWLANLNEREFEQLALQRSVCRFSDYFRPRNIILDFDADNKYEAIAEMCKKAKDLKVVTDHRWLYQVVVAREELVSTAIGSGLALLHPRHFHPSKVKKPSIIFGRSKKDIEFDAVDNQPVRLFLLLLLHNDIQHLFSISYISKLLIKKENIATLLETNDHQKIIEILTKNVLSRKK